MSRLPRVDLSPSFDTSLGTGIPLSGLVGKASEIGPSRCEYHYPTQVGPVRLTQMSSVGTWISSGQIGLGGIVSPPVSLPFLFLAYSIPFPFLSFAFLFRRPTLCLHVCHQAP